MDTVLSVLVALVAWRFLLSLAVAAAVGLVLGHLFGQVVGFAVLLSGVGFGLIWQGRWISGIPLFALIPSTPISRPIAFLGFAFIGALWGGLAAQVLGSPLSGAATLVAVVALVGAWQTVVLKRHGQLNNLVFSAASLLCGFGGIYAITALHT